MTDTELQLRLTKLEAVDPMEIGGRAGEVAKFIREIIDLRADLAATKEALGNVARDRDVAWRQVGRERAAAK